MIGGRGKFAMRSMGGQRIAQCVVVLLSVVLWTASLRAEDLSTAPELFPPLTLQLTLDEALQRNPALHAARKQAEAVRYRIPQAKALDDPMIGAEFEGIDDGEYMDVEYMASQTWPFPGKRRLRGRIATREAEIALADVTALERALIADVKTAYFALYFIERAIEINRHNRELLERAERVAEAHYASGARSMQDVLQAQVELAKLSNALIGWQQERTTAVAKLNALLNRAPATPIVIASKPTVTRLPYTLDELESEALASQPALQAAALAIRRVEAELGLAQLEFLPDVTTRVEARQLHGRGGLQEYDTMVAVNLPIWFWGKQRAQLKETSALLEAAKLTAERVKLQTLFEVRDAWARLEAAQQAAQLYETSILPQAEQSLHVSQAGYEAERVEFLQLLEAERMWKELEVEYHRTLVQFETAWADVERAVGHTLEGVVP